jgi:hypothetical protein
MTRREAKENREEEKKGMQIKKEEGAEKNHNNLPVCWARFEPGLAKHYTGVLPTRPRFSVTLILNYIYSV